MSGRVAELLRVVVEIQRLCAALLELAEPLNDNQPDYVEIIANNTRNFSSLVIEITNFLEIGSHELRTPIVVIRGFAEMLLMNMSDSLSEKQQDFVTQVNDSGKKLVGLVNTMMGEHEEC
ncbi:MAG: histidine kinase dimerization/phospho-acceptor domain-containing protein [Chloroflexota bacterium]